MTFLPYFAVGACLYLMVGVVILAIIGLAFEVSAVRERRRQRRRAARLLARDPWDVAAGYELRSPRLRVVQVDRVAEARRSTGGGSA